MVLLRVVRALLFMMRVSVMERFVGAVSIVVLSGGGSVDMVFVLGRLVRAGVVSGPSVLNGLVRVSGLRAFVVAVMELMGLGMLVLWVAVVGLAVSVAGILELVLRVVVGVASLFLVVDKGSIVSMAVNILVMHGSLVRGLEVRCLVVRGFVASSFVACGLVVRVLVVRGLNVGSLVVRSLNVGCLVMRDNNGVRSLSVMRSLNVGSLLGKGHNVGSFVMRGLMRSLGSMSRGLMRSLGGMMSLNVMGVFVEGLLVVDHLVVEREVTGVAIVVIHLKDEVTILDVDLARHEEGGVVLEAPVIAGVPLLGIERVEVVSPA